MLMFGCRSTTHFVVVVVVVVVSFHFPLYI